MADNDGNREREFGSWYANVILAAGDLEAVTREAFCAGWKAAAPHHAYAAGRAAGDVIKAYGARITELEQLAVGMLASYHQGSDGYRGRVGQVQIERWRKTLADDDGD